MKCEFKYCIYNKNFECTIDAISINALGMCDECIIVSLDKKILEKAKETQLKKIENRYK